MIFLDSLGHVWLKICLNYFQNFNAKIKNQFRISIKIWRSDNACEYFSKPLSSLLASQEILHESSCLDTTPQNSVDEQKNHLIETTRTMLIHYNVPLCFLNLCRRHILSSTLLFSSESTDVTSFLLKMFCNTLTLSLVPLLLPVSSSTLHPQMTSSPVSRVHVLLNPSHISPFLQTYHRIPENILFNTS